jgi:hypothetical protein
MPRDDDDDLFHEEFDLVDEYDNDYEDDDEEYIDNGSENEAELPVKEPGPVERKPAAARGSRRPHRYEPEAEDGQFQEEDVDEYGRPLPAPNYVVHVYEHRKYRRTIDRPFTPEDAEAFATEYNRTGKPYGRFAVAGKNDAKPQKSLD